MKRSILIALVALAALVAAIALQSRWSDDTPTTLAQRAAQSAATLAHPRAAVTTPRRMEPGLPEVSLTGGEREAAAIAALRTELGEIKLTLAELGSSLEQLQREREEASSRPIRGRHAEQGLSTPARFQSELREAQEAARDRILEAEDTFASGSFDARETARQRASIETARPPGTTLDFLECRGAICRAELVFDSEDGRFAGEGLVPLMFEVDGEIEVHPSEGDPDRLLIFTRRGSHS